MRSTHRFADRLGRVRRLGLVLVAAIAVGCSSGSAGDDASDPDRDAVGDIGQDASGDSVVTDGSTETDSATDEPPSPEPDAVPRIEFESVALDDGLVADIPVGWEPHDFLDGNYSAPDDAGFDLYRPSYWVSQQCAGECLVRTSEQWATTVDAMFFDTMRSAADTEVVREVADDTSALLETTRWGWTDLMIARWVDGQDHLVTCQLSLHEEHIDLLPEFEAACLSVTAPALDASS